MKKKEIHTYYNYQFKHTAVRVTNHPDIQTVDVAEALKIHPGVRRQFCRTCGCSLFYFDKKFPEVMFYYPATLDDGVHPGHPEGNEHHVWVESKANWETFEDKLPRHKEGVGQAALSSS